LSNKEYQKFFDKENIEPVRCDRRLNLGTVILINEYTFKDFVLTKNFKENNMLVLLKYSSVGSDSIYYVDDLEKFTVAKIKTLNLNLNEINWFIKVKKMSISSIKEFKSKCSDGQFLVSSIGDETGICELVAFDKEIRKIHSLRKGKVYKITNAEVKASSEQLHNKLVVTKKTSIFETICQDEDFPTISQTNMMAKFISPKIEIDSKFNKINELYFRKEGSLVNVLGIVIKEEETKEITPKFKSSIKLKNIFICDETCEEFKVSLWGQQAETTVTTRGSIYMMCNVKIINYFGKVGISVQYDSLISKIDENISDNVIVNELRKWWTKKSMNEICFTLKRSNTLEEVSSKKLKPNNY